MQNDSLRGVALILNRLNLKIRRTTILDPHPGLVIASLHFQEPYPLVNEIDLLSLATMDLLIQFAYPSLSGYGKFSISFTMIRSYGEEISFTLGPAIPLTYEDGKFIPMAEVYAHISRLITKYKEIYDGDHVIKLYIRVYMESKKKDGRLYLLRRERAHSLQSFLPD